MDLVKLNDAHLKCVETLVLCVDYSTLTSGYCLEVSKTVQCPLSLKDNGRKMYAILVNICCGHVCIWKKKDLIFVLTIPILLIIQM